MAGLLEESVLSGLVLLFSCQAWIELLVCLLEVWPLRDGLVAGRVRLLSRAEP